MQIQEITSFIQGINEKIIQKFHSEDTEQELAFSALAKLGEEYGELCQEVMKRFKMQRNREMDSDLGEEVADIIFAVTVLSTRLGIDIEEEIQKKMEKVRVRFEE